MKTTKLISLLILLAILSFSCKEDDDDKDDTPKLSSNASDYMYMENSTYKYNWTDVYEGDTTNSSEVLNVSVQSMENYKGQNALKTTFVDSDYDEDVYFYSNENEIYQSSNFALKYLFDGLEEDLDFITNFDDWFKIFDFKNEEWETQEYYYNSYAYDQLYGKGKYDAHISFSFGSQEEFEFSVNDVAYRGYKVTMKLSDGAGLKGFPYFTFTKGELTLYFSEAYGIIKIEKDGVYISDGFYLLEMNE